MSVCGRGGENKKGKTGEKNAQCHRAERSDSRFFWEKEIERNHMQKNARNLPGVFFVAQWN